MNRDLHVVLGATGGVGAALVTELAAQGHAVRAVSRSGRAPIQGVVTLDADITDPAALATATAGATVVYHAAQPPYTRWPDQFPAMTRAIAGAAAAADAKLVMADNLYSYGAVPGGYGPESPSGPMTESTPSRASGPKGLVRERMAQDLLARHRAGAVRVTIGRLGDYFGPGGTASLVGADLFAGAVAGNAASWPGPNGDLHSFSFLPDAARALVTLGTEDRADGQIWHLPHADAITPAAFIALVQDTAGARRRIRRIPAAALSLVGLVNPMVKELGELRYQLDRPFVIDHSHFDRTFGGRATPHAQAIAATLAAFAPDTDTNPCSPVLEGNRS